MVRGIKSINHVQHVHETLLTWGALGQITSKFKDFYHLAVPTMKKAKYMDGTSPQRRCYTFPESLDSRRRTNQMSSLILGSRFFGYPVT